MPWWSNGGDILKDGKSALDSPEAIKTAAFYKKLIDDKLTEPSPTAYSREDIFQMFKQGKLGMIFTFPMLIPQIKAEAPNLHYAAAVSHRSQADDAGRHRCDDALQRLQGKEGGMGLCPVHVPGQVSLAVRS